SASGSPCALVGLHGSAFFNCSMVSRRPGEGGGASRTIARIASSTAWNRDLRGFAVFISSPQPLNASALPSGRGGRIRPEITPLAWLQPPSARSRRPSRISVGEEARPYADIVSVSYGCLLPLILGNISVSSIGNPENLAKPDRPCRLDLS